MNHEAWSGCMLLTLALAGTALATGDVRPDFVVRAGDPQPYDGFGYGLACEGTVMLAGARGSDSTAMNGGAVYAYTQGPSGWQQVQKLVFTGAAAGDGIGEALAVAGSVGVAGAPGRGPGGAAFILRFDGGAWFPLVEVSDPAAGAAAQFGNSVACATDVVVVGAPGSAEGVGSSAGRVRVFRRPDGQWSSAEVLAAEYPDPGDRFGFAVAMSGAWLAVSSPGDDDAGINAGAVWLFRQVAGAFEFFAKLTPTGSAAENAESGFGQSLAFDGTELLVGAPRADQAGPNAGAVFRFALSPKGATPAGLVLPPAGNGSCDFGFSVAAGGGAVVVGAPGLLRGGQLTGGAFVHLGGSSATALLTAAAPTIGLCGTRVAITASSILAAAPAAPVASAGFAGELIAIDRTRDCNESGVPDAIEVANGTLPDGNGDGIPDSCQCLPDLSEDGVVAAPDLALLLGFWGTTGSPVVDADLNDDGIVSAPDLSLLLGSWGPCPN